ncbi:hypothetical protein T484DRAFT_1890604, partial [Baffinella frigidus]
HHQSPSPSAGRPLLGQCLATFGSSLSSTRPHGQAASTSTTSRLRAQTGQGTGAPTRGLGLSTPRTGGAEIPASTGTRSSRTSGRPSPADSISQLLPGSISHL